MLQKIKDAWTIVDKPDPEHMPIFHKGKPIFIIINAVIGFFGGWVLLFAITAWEGSLATWSDGRYAFPAWAPSYFVYFLLMVIPVIVTNIIYQKSRTPHYAFSSMSGIIAAGISFMFLGKNLIPQEDALWFGFYLVYVCGFSLLGNALSQRDYSLRAWHLIYFFLLGFLGNYINTIIQLVSWDVWGWLQFIHIHLFLVIIGAVKLRQWGYVYMVGWAVSALFMLILPSSWSLWIFEIPAFPFTTFYLADLPTASFYNFFVPPLLSWVILTYFFNIQRKVKKT
jgi:hypothetical protein